MDEIRNQINKFKYTLINNFNDLDLANFYSNLSTLKVILSTDEVYGKLDFYTNGYYDFKHNKIIINKNKMDEDVFFHELFHLASNSFMKNVKTNNVSVGFYQYNGNKNWGLGLNEGYTELLARRFFIKKNILYNYDFEVDVSRYLESILGKDKMVSYYLRGNLSMLIDELSKIVYKNDVLRFISNIDYVYYHIYNVDDYNKVIKIIEKINIFLISLKIKKFLDRYDLNYLIENKDKILKVNYNKEYLNKLNIMQDEDFFNYIFSKFKNKSNMR